MTIHVTIDEAGAQLAELVAAALRGEDVILAQAGTSQVRLTPVAQKSDADIERLAAKRRAALGMFRRPGDPDIPLVGDLKMTEKEQEESYRRKFGVPY